MEYKMFFSNENLLTLGAFGAFGIIVPAALIIVFAVRFKKAWKPSFIVGAGVFVLFALILEQFAHTLMLPTVRTSVVGYVIYGALAAGIFEETGRFLACLLFRKKLNAQTAFLGGLGHGGAECAILIGLNYLSYLSAAIKVNSVGLDKFIEMSGLSSENANLLTVQLGTIAAITPAMGALAMVERVLAMTAHVCFAIIVAKGVSSRRYRMYPIAIGLHALLDLGAALYQVGIVTLPVVYIYMAVFDALLVMFTVKLTKNKFRDTEKG